MKAVKLIEVVERAGGRFELVDHEPSLAWPERITAKQRRRAVELDRQVRRQVYLVTAELRERAYSRWWETNIACHCPASPYTHAPHKPQNIWRALKGEEKLWIEPKHELDRQFRRAIGFDDHLRQRKERVLK